MHALLGGAPTIVTGLWPPTVAGPSAAWMPQKSLHGRIHGVSRDGGRPRALQPSRRPDARRIIHPQQSLADTDIYAMLPPGTTPKQNPTALAAPCFDASTASGIMWR
ncbi:hypothetical protein XspCFBP7912_00310 [Xanthomonas sp. CFBP 7912]|nr:hypothetical protein XspCFBP7912_00310 [Xanthomonas sp. CFBP 7912]RJS03995.1 hypothetical protein XnspCFBP7698_12925 [Xanthomonas sp. CFBP 7698]